MSRRKEYMTGLVHFLAVKNAFGSPWLSGIKKLHLSSVVDPFHFNTDPVPMITDPDPTPDPGRILTKIQCFEIS